MNGFADLFACASGRDALRQLRAVTTGYMGTASQIKILAEWPRLRYAKTIDLLIANPVIGDIDGGIYVLAFGRIDNGDTLPLAQGITPQYLWSCKS